jgi:DNA-binding NarL/FixJ family response regulator
MRSVTVAIVDDHKLFCRSLEVMINRFRGYSVLFTASDGLDFIHKLKNQLHMPDIVVMDQYMPIMDGTATVIWLKQNYPEISVIALSMNYNENAVLSMAKSGVKGYLLKDAELHEFKEALEVVSKGGNYYPNYVTYYLTKDASQSADEEKDYDPGNLRAHEIEFMKLAASELTYKEIATKMNIGLRTVDGYRDQLFQKLNVKSRVGLVLYAIKNKIIDS